jgi:hypothetical protein
MRWRELIANVYESRGGKSGFRLKPAFYDPASTDDVAMAETGLGAKLPKSLRSLLLETNGVMEMMTVAEGAWFESNWTVWTTDKIVEENQRVRSDPLRTNQLGLAFFGGPGVDGILFGFPKMDDNTCGSNVVAWYPIGDEVREMAGCLDDFLVGWLGGALSV